MTNIRGKVCIYDGKTPASGLCSSCGAPLCSSCGFKVNGNKLCNRCYDTDQEQKTGKCQRCGSDLEAIFENNGFTEPAGPSHWEITGYKPCECRREDDL